MDEHGCALTKWCHPGADPHYVRKRHGAANHGQILPFRRSKAGAFRVAQLFVVVVVVAVVVRCHGSLLLTDR